ncbi:MAG: 50S ribosomal protein L25 [Actinobacteria bacterium]|nr:50S ribosomal protein L25 [Actinomycetota bacterium]
MDTVKLFVRRREEAGKGPARRLRKAGHVPAVVYGRGRETVPLILGVSDVRAALAHGHNVVLELQYPGDDRAKSYAVVKEIQHHPTRAQILHVDLQEVDLQREIEAAVPIELVGDAAGVAEGGMVDQQHREVVVRARPTEVPASLQLDISGLGIGGHATVAELAAPAGVEIVDDPETLVVVIHPPRLAGELEGELEMGVEGGPGEAGAAGEERRETSAE